MLLASSAQPQTNHNNDRQNKHSKCAADVLVGFLAIIEWLTLSNVIEMTMR